MTTKDDHKVDLVPRRTLVHVFPHGLELLVSHGGRANVSQHVPELGFVQEATVVFVEMPERLVQSW